MNASWNKNTITTTTTTTNQQQQQQQKQPKQQQDDKYRYKFESGLITYVVHFVDCFGKTASPLFQCRRERLISFQSQNYWFCALDPLSVSV